MTKRKIISLLAIILLLVSMFATSVLGGNENSNEQNGLADDKISKIESYIKDNMKEGRIPGLAVVIVEDGETIYRKGFGYEDTNTKSPITSKTLFELGSASKSYTALCAIKLAKEGLINLSDPVSKYIHWFKMKYIGEHRGKNINDYVDITLEQLLHHTSGIPFESIGDIPIAGGEDSIEKTVRTQVGKELSFYPGEKFSYATINYDILGLVIENVTGESFELYMGKNILEPLGLNNTYLFKNSSADHQMATGYKVNILRTMEYNAPPYRGNTPAGYFISNLEDVARWLNIQLGVEELEDFYRDLIDSSHIPNRTVAPDTDGASYASGWFVYQDTYGTIYHGGSNPNYSSYFLLRTQDKVGIGVLANLNSSYTTSIANGINDIIKGEKPKTNVTDIYISIDKVSSTAIIVCLPIALINIYLLMVLLIKAFKKERKYCGDVKKTIVYAFSFSIFLLGIAYCLYNIPDVLFWGVPWSFVKVWAPLSFLIAVILLFITIVLFCFYYLLSTLYPVENDKSLYTVSILSIVSGLGNAIIIFIINETMNRSDKFQTGLFIFFVIGIVIYVYGQRLVRIKLLNLTNNLIYNKRIYLIKNILNASFEKVEQIENGRIHAVLNNDTETISNFANIFITGVTSVVTLICCFIYLGIINLYGLLISILVILLAAGLYFVVGKYANKMWEETRNIQNVFFKFINSLINGFKELKMHNKRLSEFREEMQESCREYKEKRIKGDLGFANAFVIGELLFTMVIGVVAFVFPIVFPDIQASSLRNYIFVFLYMTGPVNGVLNSIPQIVNLRISYKRLNDLINEFDSDEMSEKNMQISAVKENQFELELIDVEYSYKNCNGEFFKVGPINCSFRSSEITFITGGNGSGKSTLAKLLTGIYTPDKGDIVLNGRKISTDCLRENYSTVFSDYFLFEKLYGIDHQSKSYKIKELLKILQIDDKVSIENGIFSTISLSSGQKKRLALLISYLEDRPMCLFDEWAADQDPEFRKLFYEQLLLDLKKEGKCIIAITHDDRYFDRADNIIKMEMGKII